MKFFVIADDDTVLGFRYAGVEGVAVDEPDEARARLQDAVKRADVGVIIMTDVVAESIREDVDRLRARGVKPLVVEIPGPAGPLEGKRTLLDLITEAVGVRI